VLTQLETVPVSHVALVLKDAQAFRDKYPELSLQHKISSLRVLGASLPLDLRVWLEQHLAERVFNSYSSNETGQIGEVTAEGVTDIYPGVQVKIVDELGGDLGLEKQGLISVKSTQVISGYVWNEELNPIHFQDGWFRTNDLGYLKSDRALVVLDRADNMLNVGGIKIPPSPMESRLKELLGVEALAIMNHPPLSDAVVVVIQSKQAAQFATIRSVVDRFFSASFPVRVVFLNEIPLNESGKIKKFELSSLIPPAV
jgi:long-chain acyl-CoA synthetase